MRIFGVRSIDAPQTLGEGGAGPAAERLIEPNAPADVPAQGWRFSIASIFGNSKAAISGVLLGAMAVATALAPTTAEARSKRAYTAGAATNTSAEVRELKAKIGRLVQRDFGGDLDRAFRHYDRNGDRALDSTELMRLLTDAGIGNDLTRGLWVAGLIKHFDSLPGAVRNGKVDWRELQSAMR